MNLFIDTNIFLSFFHFTSDDLEKLHKLIALIRNGKLVLWLPQQAKDEFYRNREKKLQEALDTIKKLKMQQSKSQYPALCKDYPEYEKLRTTEKEFESTFVKLTDKLTNKINKDIAKKSLKADKVINDLFNKAEYIKTTTDLIDSARNRVDIGNPPGKEGSLGDAINWLALLGKIPNKEDLHFVSGDSDYYSVLDGNLMKDFLRSEWKTNKESNIYVYKGLTQFFEKHYPDIKLASELEVKFEIESLMKSDIFSQNHAALTELSKRESGESEMNDIVRNLILLNTKLEIKKTVLEAKKTALEVKKIVLEMQKKQN